MFVKVRGGGDYIYGARFYCVKHNLDKNVLLVRRILCKG